MNLMVCLSLCCNQIAEYININIRCLFTVKKSLFGSDKDEPGSAESVKLSDSKEIREEVTASVVAMEVTDLTGAEDSEKSPSTATDMFASTPLKEAHVVLPSVGGGTLQTLWSKQKENRAVAKTLDSTDSGESAIHSANSVVPMEIDSAPICSEGFATNKNQNDSAEFVVTDVDEVNNLTSEEALSAGMSPTVGSDEATVANERVTLAPKKRNRKKSVKAASASALVEEGSEVTAPAAKKRRVTKKATASSTVITDVDSCVAEVVNPTKVSTPTGSLPATPVANKIEYSPEILAKIEINNEKIKHFVEELQATEKLVDLFDSNLDIDEAINALLEQCMSKELKINLTAGSTTESILEDTVVNSSGITDSADPESIGSSDRVPVDVVMAIRTVIARKVQGSSLPLSAIIPDIIELFISLKKKVVEGVGATAENDSVSPLQCIDKYCEPLKLSEDIKLLASRESYGLKGKNAPLFEDSDQLACWRWDTTSSIYFTKTGQGIIREVKTVRSRYSRAIKAVVKVVEQLKKMPYDEAKVAFTEEKLAKVVVEIEKAKEKRREMDGKRAADLEEKSKREAIKEEKKREKEETELMKKEMNESIAFERAMKKKKPSNTENEKKKALLEKQKNVFMNFLSSKKLVDTPPVPDKSVSEKIRNGLPPAHSSSTKEVEDFNRNIRVTMEMADIINSYRLRYKKRGFVNSTLKNSKTPRGKKKILVAVTQNEGSAFGGGEYTEMKEKWVDNRMRLFSFAEDYRPAYWYVQP